MKTELSELRVFQEPDTGEELNTWYVARWEGDNALDNEYFETEKEAQDYLDWFVAENATFKRPVNWLEEGLQDTYGDDNDGHIYGIYLYEGDEVIDVQWYKTEEERDKNLAD